MIEELTKDHIIRNHAIHWAWETHFNKFNVSEKPSPSEIIDAALVFEQYLRTGNLAEDSILEGIAV